MKYTCLSSLLALMVFSTLLAQTPDMTSTLYAKRLVTNFYTDLGDHSPLDMDNYRGGFELAYGQNLGRLVNIVFPFKTTVFRLPEETENQRYFSLGGRLQLHHNIGRNFSPYLLAGAGVIIMSDQKSQAQIPLGAGINIRINPNLGLNLQSEYRVSLDGGYDHYQHGIGLFFNFGQVKQEEEEKELPAPPAPDRDGDSIVDSLDHCPDIAGLAAFSGCPDSDNDGISDQTDACPDLAGLKEYNGCPDTDGDGFSDLEDECPDQPGRIRGCPPKDSDEDGVPDTEDECPQHKGTLRGCPDRDNDQVADSADRCPDNPGPVNTAGCPDSDNDGLDDGQDMCPNKPGPASNKGCPEIAAEDKATLEFAMQAVNFQSGSDKLTLDSYAILDQIAGIMVRYPDYRLNIEGHTDNVGEADFNLGLSQRRAQACLAYLVSKGISDSRLSAFGFGEAQPRASNETEEGRRLNRRVEFEMRLH